MEEMLRLTPKARLGGLARLALLCGPAGMLASCQHSPEPNEPSVAGGDTPGIVEDKNPAPSTQEASTKPDPKSSVDTDPLPLPDEENPDEENPNAKNPGKNPGENNPGGKDPDVPDPKKRDCDIDFLFVVDNSKSMRTKQKNLVNSVPNFVDTLIKELDHEVDFHLGVITTDAYFGNPATCQKLGALVTSTQGRKSSNHACGPYGEGRNYMTREDPIENDFPCAATPGIDGDPLERVIDGLRGAFSPELSKAGGCNEGFLRDDAILVTVVITDEDDGSDDGLHPGSEGNPAAWHKEILAVKKGDPRRLVMLGLLAQPKPNQCGGNQVIIRPSLRLTELLERFKDRAIIGDVCAPDYDPFFEKAISMLDLACDELVPPM